MQPRLKLPPLFVLLLVSGLCSAWAEPPAIYDSEQSREKPISGEAAVKKITLQPGFEARLFAAEPTVRNPIALQYDNRGRLWIAENYTYAERGLRLDPNLRDRLIILEDTNRDGKADKTTVFSDQLHTLTGFALGHGGVWAICPPQLLFIADANADDRPDQAPVVVLDGFEVAPENHHNFANGLKFGPDGWLYGRCGGTFPGEIGRPGTPASQRVPLRGGIWRYHPKTKAVEVLTHGTTNPWGMDWDAHGEAFFTNTVNGHLWHLIPGSHLDRLHTIDPNPDTFQLMQQTANHFHSDTGQGWIASRNGAANSLGGGHAHQGALIYQGGTWPEKYNGRLLTCNFHGRRINQDFPRRAGSGYAAGHETDFAIFGDTWFRGLDMAHTPDGNIMVIDWSDTGECHENTGVHRSSGRIYEIGTGLGKTPILAEFKPGQLLDDLKSTNIYIVRRALRQVADHPADYQSQIALLKSLLQSSQNEIHRLRAMWALQSLGALNTNELIQICHDQSEHLRAWAVRFLMDQHPLDTIMGLRPVASQEPPSLEIQQTLLKLAASDTSGLVRLVLSSCLQRLQPDEFRWQLATALAGRDDNAMDINLSLMVWHGVAPMSETSPMKLAQLASSSRWPLLNQFLARKLASTLTATEKNQAFDSLLQSPANKSAAIQSAILKGMKQGLAGRDKVAEPALWKSFAAHFPKDQTQDMATLFGDGLALDQLRKLALDPKADMKQRSSALKTLIARNPPDLARICTTLLGTRYLNIDAMEGLARNSDQATAQAILNTYQNFAVPERHRVIDILVQRPAWAALLLQATAKDRIPKRDISLAQAKRIQAFGDQSLNDLLARHWGKTGLTNEAKLKFVSLVKDEMKSADAKPINFNLGRELYLKSCGQCHTLYGEGGRIGPDITGAQRQNLDYLLENIVEPSAVVAPDFRLSNLQLKDGRVLSGLVRPRDQQSLTLITTSQTVILQRNDIEEEKRTDQSIMPEGQLEALSPADRKALLQYLMTETPPAVNRTGSGD